MYYVSINSHQHDGFILLYIHLVFQLILVLFYQGSIFKSVQAKPDWRTYVWPWPCFLVSMQMPLLTFRLFNEMKHLFFNETFFFFYVLRSQQIPLSQFTTWMEKIRRICFGIMIHTHLFIYERLFDYLQCLSLKLLLCF